MRQLFDYQTGNDKPGAVALPKLAKAGGVTVDWILEFEAHEAPETYGGIDPKD